MTPIQRIRHFYRAVSRESGALDTSFLGRGRPSGTARLLWSIPRFDGDLAAIRRDMAWDSGLFSRTLRSLEAEDLITLTRQEGDARRRTAHLTDKGRAEVALYDDLSDQRAARQLGRNAGALLDATDLIANTLNVNHVQIRPADPDDPAAQSCLRHYFTLLPEKVAEVTVDTFPLPDPDAHKYRPPHGTFLIAWFDSMPLGCVSLRPLDGTTAEVKRLWVAPHARGQGLARRLMLSVETAARGLGYSRLNLDTNAALPEAIALYRTTCWSEIPPYSGFPSTHWFTKSL